MVKKHHPAFLAKPFLQPLGLAMRETPYKLRHYHAKLDWHARDQNDLSHRWLRELIKEISSNLTESKKQ